MSANGNGLPGLPGFEMQPEQRQVVVTRENTFHDFSVLGVDQLPDGGRQVTFLVAQTGELFRFPLNQAAAEKLGLALAAPSVALPDGTLR